MRRGATLVLGLLLSGACSSTGATGSGATGTGGTGAGGTTSGPGGTTTGSGAMGGGAGTAGASGKGGNAGGAPDGGTVCLEPLQTPFAALDLYFLVDKSTSMATVDPPNVASDTRWKRLEDSLDAFELPTGQPFRIGVGFFPMLAAGQSGPASCTNADYASPSVGLHLLDDDTPVAEAMAAQSLGGEAPTGPAYRGALAYALQWAASDHVDEPHARTPPSIALITDGPPTACGSTVEDVASAASAAFRGTPRIRTYVIAVGPDASGLDAIAEAGGTARAIPSGARDLDEAFEKLSRSRIICDIPLEDALIGSPDLMRVEVRSRLVRTAPFAITPRVANAESCGTDGGWFFEPPDKPTMILMCPSTCAALIDAPGEMWAGLRCDSAKGVLIPAR